MMKAGYIQTLPVFGDKEQNFDAIRLLTEDVAADLLVLPELFATGYVFTSKDEVVKLSETTDGPTAAFLSELSEKTGAIVAGGFIEKEGGHYYNAMMIVQGHQVVGTYRKVHLFHREKIWFTPGNKAFKVTEINGYRIGAMICFDWIYPEVCRSMALQGMQVLVHPSNLVLPWCQAAMVTRCLENHVFAITANRIGREKRGNDDLTFTGASQITAPNGEILSSAPVDCTCVDVVNIDEAQADLKKINAFNDVMADRRPDLYYPC